MAAARFPTREEAYDFIFLGAGCAALSILMRMLRSGRFADKKILLIDRERKTKNDRTWCFWEKKNGFFNEIVYKKWSRLSVLSDEFSDVMDISPYEYKMIRGIDFYDYCFAEIAGRNNIDLLHGVVTAVDCDKECISIVIDGALHRFARTTVFNSFPGIHEDKGHSSQEITLLQHFKGWVIETSRPVFDPSLATFMDFRVNQHRGTTFAYVLPFSENKALVEYTLFTESVLRDDEYEMELQNYIKHILKIDDYRIAGKEFGIIPMTTRKFDFYSRDMYYIGVAGGQTKPSTGYTFQFIQKQSDRIIQHLLLRDKALAEVAATPKRFLFYDKVLLDVLYNKRAGGKEVFTTLFKKNRPGQVLKFLDNESSLSDELAIISSLQTLPFLKAALNQF